MVPQPNAMHMVASTIHVHKRPKQKQKIKHKKNPEKPHKIEAMLRNPSQRKHVGPCCKTFDGTISGTMKWGDGDGCALEGTDERTWVCSACRKELDPGTAEDEQQEDTLFAAMVADASARGF